MAKKKKKKDKKGFGGVIVPVFLTFAVLFSLGYIGKQSLQSGGMQSQMTLEEEKESSDTYPDAPQKTVKEEKPSQSNSSKKEEPVKKSGDTNKKEENKPTKPQNTAAGQKKASSYSKDASIKKLLQNAIKPVGSTMFVMGGGWNGSDSGAGSSAVTLGLSSKWKSFADKQNSSYNYKNITDTSLGLDGSGYVGWVLYNTLRTQSGSEGFVVSAGTYDEKLTSLGFGKRTPKEDVTIWRPGDIMCSETDGFVYIVLGSCADGSLLLVCSSPPGVRICGTPAKNGNTDSEALILAEQIMNDHFGQWYRRYPDCAKDYSYLTNYDKFSPTNTDVFKDNEGIRTMNAKEVIDILF